MKKRKVNITLEELHQIVNSVLREYQVEKEKKGNLRVEGDFPDIGELVSKIKYSNPNIRDFVDYEQEELNESLMSTYDANKVKRIVCRKFGLDDSQFSINPVFDNGTRVDMAVIMIPKSVSKSEKGEIKQFMNSCGYFENFNEIVQGDKVFLMFEPRFSKDIIDEIKSKYKRLYHATPTVYVEKILKKGLIPRSKNTLFFYPNRVYFMRGDNLNNTQINTFKNIQGERGRSKHYDNNEYTILSIDTSKLQDNIKFYVDPNVENGIMTYDNIPPSAITVCDRLKENKHKQ